MEIDAQADGMDLTEAKPEVVVPEPTLGGGEGGNL